jgi:formylglycine-generating enzyme required for sulfatase activity
VQENAAPPAPKFVTNSIGMKLVLIPAGEFMMGSADSEKTAFDDEKPRHRVRITKPFYLGACPVTQSQYKQVLGFNPSWYQKPGIGERSIGNEVTSSFPVEGLSWDYAMRFCGELSDKENKHYMLPTEAQWEYACRAGSETRFCYGDDEGRLGEYAWYRPNSGDRPRPVGQKRPNAWGLFDMHGHVWEWCADWYGEGYYRISPVDDPTGPVQGKRRVVRGGCYDSVPKFCRSAVRFSELSNTSSMLGFRVCLDANSGDGAHDREQKTGHH